MSGDEGNAWVLDPGTINLNHGSFGSCPRPVLEHQSRLREQMEGDPIVFLLRELEERLDHVRTRVGSLVGAAPEDIALVTNATHAANAVFSSIDLEPGDEIVVTDHGYAAVSNAAARWAERAGARVAVARIPFPLRGPADALEAVMAEVRHRTKLVVVDQVTSPTALILPIAEITGACRARGVEVFVDAAHGPGMLPVELDRWGTAYATGNFHKWICAPKGAAFLHVRRDLRPRVRPLVTSHGATSDRKDRSRFFLEFDWTGTDDPTAMLSVPAAIDFVEGLHPDGLEGLRRANHDLVVRGRQILAERVGLSLPAPEEMLGSMASLSVPAGPMSADELYRHLFAKYRIHVPFFPWPNAEDRTIRISAQRYNAIEQYEALADALRLELNRT